MMESHIIQHNSTTTSTTTNAISTEREEVMTECIHGTMQSVVFLNNTTLDHKSISNEAINNCNSNFRLSTNNDCSPGRSNQKKK